MSHEINMQNNMQNSQFRKTPEDNISQTESNSNTTLIIHVCILYNGFF